MGSRRRRAKSVVALWLTFTAGFVDIVGFLAIYRLFTAHMTGTTVRIAEQFVHRNWHEAALASSIVAAFFLGSILGRILIEIGSRVGLRRIGSVTLAIEAALLAGSIRSGTVAPSPAAIYVELAMLASAMGLQTATLTGIGPLTIHTTFVTGMLNKLAQLVARILLTAYDLSRRSISSSGNEHRRKRQDSSREARFIFAIWVLYLAGAGCGTWAADQWQLRALYLPSSMLLGAIGIDQMWPLSIEEEREQEHET